ncbi:MAG TPA: uroporphyrinogen decarboxylase [Candidatus Baltobacteraceae bacterium]|nr:uroporphyrinogen decarboxylase [Candidatus Baltobacteraceae bacterium]
MTLLEAALRGESTRRAPIWIMRQAGRYLPEYRAIKERSSFLEMTRDPAIAAEITLQPLRRFALDAAIVFSDIMTPLEALGIEIAFAPGPSIAHPLRSRAAIDALTQRDEIAPFVGEALRIVRAELSPDVALIGFAGAPLTLAAYLVEGGGSKEFEQFRKFLRADPAALHALLEKLTELTIAYVRMQAAAGAGVVQLFDSWAGLHDAPTYREFGAPYVRRIMDAVGESGAARILFALDAAHLLDEIAAIPAEAVGVDWRTPLGAARARLPGRALQGNLDPAVLFADGATIEREARRVLREGLGGAHVFNLGHGVWQATPVDAVARLVDTVRGFERA